MGEMSSLLLASQGVSAASGLAGGIAQANAMRGQGSAERMLANTNASYMDRQALDVRDRGAVEASRQMHERERMASSARAVQGASGVDVNSGSAALASSELRLLGELDAITIKNNAAREAMGYSIGALNERTRGRMGMIAANNAARQSVAQAGMNAGRDLTQGALLYEKYKGLEEEDGYKKPKYAPQKGAQYDGGLRRDISGSYSGNRSISRGK